MIWGQLILFVASFLLSQLLAPKPEIEDARPGRFDPAQFPRIDAGSAIPYIFGRVRLRAPNVVWYGDFRATPNRKKVRTGIFGSDEIIVSYTYFLGLTLALCLGPGCVLRRIWMERKLLFVSGGGVTGGTVFSVNQPNIFGGPERGGGFQGSLAFYSGEFTQAADSYELAQVSALVPGYVGIARLVLRGASWGTAPTLRPMSFEIERYPNNLGLGAPRIIGTDLNPMEILYSILTEEWGGAARPASDIDATSFIAAAATLATEVHGMSITFAGASDARACATEVLRQIDGILYQDPATGKIAVRLIRADYTVGTLPLFDPSNVEMVQNWSRTGWKETYNQVRVGFTDRSRLYEQSTAIAQDHANISAEQTLRSTTFSFPGVTTAAVAQVLAARELSQLSVPLFRATLQMNRQASALSPGSVFRFTWPDYGLTDIVMRIQKYDAGELAQGHLVADVMQDKFSASNVLFGDPEISLWAPLDHTAPTIVLRNVHESPWYIVNNADAQSFLVWTGTTFTFTPNSSWLVGLARPPVPTVSDRFDLVTSRDLFTIDITTERDQKPYPYSWTTVDDLWFWQGMENGLLTQLDIQSQFPTGAIPIAAQSATTIRTNVGYGIGLLNGEYISWETVTDLGGGVIRLGNVRRALLDSQFQTHAAGSVFFLINSANWLSRNAHPETSTIDYRLLSYTDADAQDITMVSSQTVQFGQGVRDVSPVSGRYERPLPPDFITTSGIRTPIEMVEQTTIPLLVRTRRRTDNLVDLYNDGGSGAEASTTHTARFYLDGLVYVTNSAIPGVGTTVSTTLNIPAGLVGVGRVEVEAVLSGQRSWTPDFWEFYWAGYPNLSAERITNPNFEGSLTGWTTISGSWAVEATAYPLDAIRVIPGYTNNTRHARATAASSELRQDYTIAGGEVGDAALLSWYKGGKLAGATGQMIVELRDASTALKTITTPLEAAVVGKWERGEISLPLRSDATTVRVRVMGTSAESVWDQISLRTNTQSAANPFHYDSIGTITAVTGAWGLRRMVSTYSGPLVKILDTAFGTEQDVGIDPDGHLEPFFVKGEARVTRLYDQSGNGSHLDPPTAADRPRLVSFLSETGRPGIRFDLPSTSPNGLPTTGALLVDTNAASTSRPYMTVRPNMMLAIGPQLTADNNIIISIPHQDSSHASPFQRWALQTGGTDWRPYLNGAITNVITSAPNPNTLGQKHGWFSDYQNGAYYHNTDAATAATFTAADVTYPNNTRLRIGRTPPGQTLQWDGMLFELAIFTGNVSAGDRQTIIEGVGDYWYNAAY